jgi:hypothetical protein
MSNITGVQNVDVRPSLSATLNVSKAVLLENSLLGSGPNTFDRDWLVYKTPEVNTTPFWSVSFPFGIGFIPTQVASTGALGTLAWLVFLAIILFQSVKTLIRLPESRAERFVLVSTMFISLFLWTASIIYPPSTTVLIFAFIFSGLFLASGKVSGIINSQRIGLKDLPRMKFATAVILLVTALGTVYVGWESFEKTAAAYHFQKAINLANVPGSSLDDIELMVTKAIEFSAADTYHVALSRIKFAKEYRYSKTSHRSEPSWLPKLDISGRDL